MGPRKTCTQPRFLVALVDAVVSIEWLLLCFYGT
jgi:hypothetical protein